MVTLGKSSPPHHCAGVLSLVQTLVLTSCLLLLGLARGQEATWNDVVQTVEILADGTVIVDDVRTAEASGGFQEAFICLRLQPDQRVTLLDGSGALDPGPSATAFTQACTVDGAMGTEMVVRNEWRVGSRRVRFHYRLEGSTDFFADVVQWYWRILEEDHLPVRGYRLTVNAPGPMAEPYDAYVHRWGNTELPRVDLNASRDRLTVEFDRIPSTSGVTIRYFMDPALFTMPGLTPGFERLLLDEHREAGVQNLLVTKRRPIWALIPLGIFAALGGGVLRQYLRTGREPRTTTMKYPFEPPSDLPPAAVPSLFSQSASASDQGPAFHATIMDLMRRGHGVFVPRGPGKVDIRLHPDADSTDLLPFEQEVLTYLGSVRRKDPELITHEELRRHSQRAASTFLSRFGRTVRGWLLEQKGGELTTEASRKEANRWALRSLAAIPLLAVGFLLTAGQARVSMGVGAGLLLVLAIVAKAALPAWRPEIAQEVAEWRGFRRTLTDYTRMKEAPLDFFNLWDVYYAYAAALGVAKKYLATLQKAAPVAGADEATMVSRANWVGAGNVASLASLSSLSSTINALSSSLSASSASASSGGSSGGGGGGGGGSSGVR